MAEIELAKDLTSKERSSKILDQVERVTRSKVRIFFKVQWEHHTESEATWEQEELLKCQYPEWFSQAMNLEDEIHSKWERFVTAWFLPFLICLKFHLNVFETWSF